MKRRGLSNVLVTVLIVLIAIIAAILVWIYIKSSIIESSQQVEMQQKCYVVDSELQSCDYSSHKLNDYYFVSGLVKHNEGNPTDIRVAFYAQDGSSVTRDMQPVEILESKKILPPTRMPNPPVYAVASPIIYNQDKSEDIVCPISKKTFCQPVRISGNLCELPTSVEDVNDFVATMNDGSNYHRTDCNWTSGDFSCDGHVSWPDIDPFVKALENGWVLCTKDTICNYVSANPPQTGNWWNDPSIEFYFNQTCR